MDAVRSLINRITVTPAARGEEIPLTIEGNLAIMLERERLANGMIVVVPPPRIERGTSRSTI